MALKVNVKKIILIAVALVFVIIVCALLIPFSAGMSYGFDSAEIESALQKNCNCEVKVINAPQDSSVFIDDVKSQKLGITFYMELTQCKYENLQELQESLIHVLQEKAFCKERNIQFVIPDFKQHSETFEFKDCKLLKV